ncbi:MAG: 2-oxo acid dehydrogenase subunit E2 [Magnetovibrio sp.]|nr:2-oxo acid dehydrogenase subunit E2 [Magnetovibrio sp.]
MNAFNLPDLGEGLDEAEIVDWHVEIGDHVVIEQPLLSVETDKAVVEIPSPTSGTVTQIFVRTGEFAKVGAPLIDFDTAQRDDIGAVVGDLPNEENSNRKTKAAVSGVVHSRVKATPAVRALAKKLTVNLEDVAGTGSGGSVTAADVERVAKAFSELPPAEPLRGVRRTMAHKMAQSHAEVVPASVYDEVDISHWDEDTDISVRLMQAIAAGCHASPSMNAWYDSVNKERRLLDKVDLGLAVNTNNGLFVPVMRDIGARSADDLRLGLNELRAAVEQRNIPPEEMQGATITLSNFGMFGAGRFATLVVIPPQVSIVGAGAIRDKVIAVAGLAEIRKVLPLSLTFDHRVITGAEATLFLTEMCKQLGH